METLRLPTVNFLSLGPSNIQYKEFRIKNISDIITMNANETQTTTGIATSKDEVIIFSLASILTLSLIIHAYYLGYYIWRKRLIYVQGKNRLTQDQNLPRGDEGQGV